MSSRVAACILLPLLFSSSCTGSESNRALVSGQENMASPTTKTIDPELTRLIKTFSEDVGENGQAAWRELQSRPRKDLIHSLSDMRANLPKDSAMQYSIAFVLCNLDHEYRTNVQVIVSALTNVPHNQNYYADLAAGMLGRLIHRGDKSLLRVLFGAAPWSDAALSEELSGTFSEELRDDPKSFLFELKDEPKESRSRVYTLIDSGSLTAQHLKKLRGQLASLPRTAPISEVARELLASPVFKK